MGYTRDWTKEELVDIILHRRGEDTNYRRSYLELRKHPLMKNNKETLRAMAQKELERNRNEDELLYCSVRLRREVAEK